jgi:hypothetical protein
MIGKLFRKPSQEAGFGYSSGVGGLPSQRIVGTGVEALFGGASGSLQVSLGISLHRQNRL